MTNAARPLLALASVAVRLARSSPPPDITKLLQAAPSHNKPIDIHSRRPYSSASHNPSSSPQVRSEPTVPVIDGRFARACLLLTLLIFVAPAAGLLVSSLSR